MDEIMNSRSQSQEVFERVWARVMGSATPQTAAQPQPEPVSQPAPEAQPVMAPQTMAAAPQRPHPAPPRPQPAPPAQPKTCCLRQQVLDSLEQWQLARLLSRRAGKQSRQMSNVAAQLHQQAKQLSAAYFLQSGVRYWPVAQLTAPRMTTYVGGLRHLYQRNQALTQEFQTCRAKAGSPDLMQLYSQLAQEGVKRAALLRHLLEQTGM